MTDKIHILFRGINVGFNEIKTIRLIKLNKYDNIFKYIFLSVRPCANKIKRFSVCLGVYKKRFAKVCCKGILQMNEVINGAF